MKATVKLLLPSLFLLAITFNVQGVEINTKNNGPEFIEPETIKRASPKYPQIELDSANAGMVEMLFMVDKTGKTFEPIIQTSSHKNFETAALASLKKYKYKPATLDGIPVESVKGVRVLFLVDKQTDQVSSKFNKNYKRALKELNNEIVDQKKVEKNIIAMENSPHLSPYAFRHLNTVKHAYAKQFDTTQGEIDAIYQLLLFDKETKDAKKAFNETQRINIRRRLVALLIQTTQYGSAIREYRILKSIDPEAKSLFKKPFKQIADIQNSDQIIKTTLKLNEKGSNLTSLFKRSFGFIGGQNISKVKLRCSRKFADLDYKPESEYQIPRSWGACYLETIGTPNTSIELYQL